MPKAKLKAKTKRRRPRPPVATAPRRPIPPAAPLITLPMGEVAMQLATNHLGRGAMVNTPGQPAFYLPWSSLKGSVRSLVEVYKPTEEWVLIDATLPISVATILPLDEGRIRVSAWPGATARDAADAIARDNQRLAAVAMANW